MSFKKINDEMNSEKSISELVLKGIQRVTEKNEFSPIPEPIVIENETNTTLIVCEKFHTPGVYVVYRHENSQNEIISVLHPNTFSFLYFENCDNTTIFIHCKLLKLFFYHCNNLTLSIKKPTIGMIEFYSCSQMIVYLQSPFPMCRIEDVKNLRVYQSENKVVYIIKMSIDIEVSIKTVTQNYELGKLFWQESEQNIVSLSSNEYTIETIQDVCNDVSLILSKV